MGVLVFKYYMFRKGCVWKCEHVRWTPCRFSPPGDSDASGAEGGVAEHRGERPVELPRLARPKRCFVTSD